MFLYGIILLAHIVPFVSLTALSLVWICTKIFSVLTLASKYLYQSCSIVSQGAMLVFYWASKTKNVKKLLIHMSQKNQQLSKKCIPFFKHSEGLREFLEANNKVLPIITYA